MSLKSWKQKFYPITALQASKKLDLVGLVEHTIRKWTGLIPKNLKEHDGTKESYYWWIHIGKETFHVAIDSCSLCQKFISQNGNCVGCPLYESRNGFQCDEPRNDEKDSPYGTWVDTGNPAPMLKALRKALKWAKAHPG